MAKGSYTVGETPNKDSSFRSCLCALLIFIAICAILLLIGIIKWRHDEGKKQEKEDLEYLGLHGSERVTQKLSEKMIYQPTTTEPSIIPKYISTNPTTTEKVVETTTFVTAEGKREVELITTLPPPTTTLLPTTTPPQKALPPLTTIPPHSTTTSADDNVTSTTSVPNITTTVLTTTEKTTRMPIDIRYQGGENVTTTERETTTVKITTTTHTEESLEVVEATGYGNTEDDDTTTQFPETTTANISTTTSASNNITTTYKPKDILKTTTQKPEEPVCSTGGCKSVASRILSLMNHSVDPCEDFYEFACGGMQVDNDDYDSWKRLSEQVYLINGTSLNYLQLYTKFYNSCVAHEYIFNYDERTAKVRELVKEVGVIKDDGVNDVNITQLLAKLILRRSLFIMDVELDINKATSRFILKLTVPKFTSVLYEDTGHSVCLTELQRRCLDRQRWKLAKDNINLNTIHAEYIECQKNYSVLLQSVKAAVTSLGFYSHFQNEFNRTQAMQDLLTTIEWDLLEHSSILPPPNQMREKVLLKEYEIKTVSELQSEYPLINWKEFLKILTDMDFEGDAPVQVYFPDYFQSLFEGMGNIPKWKINNALIALYANHLYEKLVIPNAKNTREFYCLRLSTKMFRDISSKLYMKSWSKQDIETAKKFSMNIFDNIKKNLEDELKASDWLDDSSKGSMLNKVKKMKLTVNKLEDSYNNDIHLEQKYSNVQIVEDDFIHNIIEMMEFDRKALYNNTGRLLEVDQLWSYFVNIFDNFPTSFYSEGLIMAPLGMMKESMKGYPGYIMMSRIGLSLAREIGRHFDPAGIQNDMILSPTSKPIYDEMVTVISNDKLLTATDKVFQNKKVTFEGYPILSLNSRISDNTGLNLITSYLKTLKAENTLPWISTTFSKEKIFFISIAQEYCQITSMIDYMLALFQSEILPPSLRVENIVTNSKAFSDIFSCPQGSLMNNNPTKLQFPNLVEDANISHDDSQGDLL